jgi:hypothetical protein
MRDEIDAAIDARMNVLLQPHNPLQNVGPVEREAMQAAISAAVYAARQDERDKTIEECAAACRSQAENFLSPAYAVGQPMSSFSERFACEQCEKAIRALKG